MPKKRHFTGEGTCKIHTARGGECSKKKCNYQTNAGAKLAFLPNQAHHLLPVTSTVNYQVSGDYTGKVRAIDAVYRQSDWCVHNANNMMWLPLKGTYTKRPQTGTKAAPGPAWALKLPCHDWDHNCAEGFTDEVIAEFGTRIWDKIANPKEGECFEPEDAPVVFEQFEKDMRQRLEDRGSARKSGAKDTLAARQDMTAKFWWLPFSMAKTAVAKTRTVRVFGQRPESPRAYAR